MFTRGNMFDFPHSPGSAPALKLRTSASAQLAGSCSRMDLFIEAPNKQGGWLINSLIREFGINKKWINTYNKTNIHIKIYQELINTAVSFGHWQGSALPPRYAHVSAEATSHGGRQRRSWWLQGFQLQPDPAPVWPNLFWRSNPFGFVCNIGYIVVYLESIYKDPKSPTIGYHHVHSFPLSFDGYKKWRFFNHFRRHTHMAKLHGSRRLAQPPWRSCGSLAFGSPAAMWVLKPAANSVLGLLNFFEGNQG